MEGPVMLDPNEIHPGDEAKQFLKVTAMGTWRLTLLFYPSGGIASSFSALVLSSIFAAVLVYGLGRTVWIAPILQLVLKQRFPFPRKNSARQAGRSQAYPRPSGLPSGASLKSASRKGKMTGYEPSALAKTKLQRSPWIVGDPGFGLDASGFDKTSVKLGQEGERNFAKALQRSGLIDNFQSFWSASVPDRSGLIPSRTYDTDIDCILFNGRTVYLVDLKNYKGGDVTYSMANGYLQCRDNGTGKAIEVTSKLSKNMEMALEMTRNHLKYTAYRVEARVVFMPTESGMGSIKGVFWPGQIPALYLPAFLQELKQQGTFDTSKDHSGLSGALGGLVKKR